ncbi:hypothetical protein UFOVP724_47 [uncultured Caudovirales phage]|uniref:Uncharacterized protein n=1 Tax=uncultured Caudovirales phage TaxID=2100421 RepID=A0A6J5NMQ1_9CAUD|nr:hypothetical protein UFOVP724_47 [uncultured Caudovirales phage]
MLREDFKYMIDERAMIIDTEIEEYMNELPELLNDTLFDLGVDESVQNTFYIKDIKNDYYRVTYLFNDKNVAKGNLVTICTKVKQRE